ncbi:MAG: alpha/beta fold hydrolase [Candidatus Binatia bacterium]
MDSDRNLAPPGTLHHATTADGWRLALRRYDGGPERLPVILCPGYGCSGLFLDYDERHSLARYLAGRGFDAWVLDLRGRGGSSPLGTGGGRWWSWTFDDLVRYDVPAAIEAVRSATRRSQVAWVGHSMGGAALYAFVGTTPIGREAIGAAVTIAAPILFPATAWRLLRRLGEALIRLPFARTVPQREMVAFFWNAIGATGLLLNPDNIDRRLAGLALRKALHNVSIAKLRQLACWSSEQVFCSADRTIDYRAALRRFTTPILVAAGRDDRLARPESVHLAVEEIGSSDREFVEFGEEAGHSADYGHIDLILGRRARDEVFPRVGDWLDARTRAAS